MGFWKFFSKKKDKKKDESQVESQESRVDEIEEQETVEQETVEQETGNSEPETRDPQPTTDVMEVHEEELEEAGIESNVECGIGNVELEEQETVEQEAGKQGTDEPQTNEEQKVENREKEVEKQDQNSQFSIDNSQLDTDEPETRDPQPTTLTEEEMRVAEKPKAKSWFARLKSGLSKTRDNFTFSIRKILNFGEIDEDTLEELEDLFIQADIGTTLTLKLVEQIEKKSIMGELSDTESVMSFLKEEFKKILERDNKIYFETSPKVFLIVGVNGAGKTTTIGKLTKNFKQNGKSVLLVAGDTFRAAAIEQLEIWANRNSCPIIKHSEGSDSAAVVFDGVSAGVSRKMDTILVDTAGRLHNKVNLMKELEKIKRVVKKAAGDVKVETLLVIDATSGQNGLIQAKTFKEVIDIDGILLTKMDGTAKGGIILPIVNDLNVPVKYIGVGEGIDDLKEFSAEDFVNALFD